MTQRYRRTDAFDEEDFDDDLVVMNTRNQAVLTLNGTARIVWDALAEGAALDDLVALFAEAFPDADPDTLGRDVTDILARLEEAELVVASGGNG